MKYKKSVQQRRYVRELPMSWETYYMSNAEDKLINPKPVKNARHNQLRSYYRRNGDGLGFSELKLRENIMIDTLAGIALGALPEDLIYDREDDV